MNKSIRSDNMTIADKLIVNQHETQHPPIWFSYEDINDTHAPELNSLLSRCFQQWINETSHSPLAAEGFALCDHQGRVARL